MPQSRIQGNLPRNNLGKESSGLQRGVELKRLQVELGDWRMDPFKLEKTSTEVQEAREAGGEGVAVKGFWAMRAFQGKKCCARHPLTRSVQKPQEGSNGLGRALQAMGIQECLGYLFRALLQMTTQVEPNERMMLFPAGRGLRGFCDNPTWLRDIGTSLEPGTWDSPN